MNQLPTNKDENPPKGTKDDKSHPTIHAKEEDNKIPNNNKDNGQGKAKIGWPHKLTALCTLAIVIITFLYTYYAKEQVTQMKKTIEITERAWVGVHAVSAQIEIGKPIITFAEFINTGKTPAKDVTICAVGEAVVRDSHPNYGKETMFIESKGIVYPQQKFRVSLQDTTQPPLNPAGFEQIEKKDAWIYIHDIVTYNDIYGKKHWFTYCMRYEPDRKSFSAYKEHNDTDNN